MGWPGANCSTQRSDTLMQLSRSSILEVHLVRTAGPYIVARSGGSHFDARGALSARTGHASKYVRHSAEAQGEGQLPVRCVKKELALARTWPSGVYSGRGAFKDALHCTGKLLTPSRGHRWAIYEYTP